MTDVMAMPPPLGGFFLDANLLVLFVVGRVYTAIISRHRRRSVLSCHIGLTDIWTAV